jgi:hypothetical protein
VQAQPGGGHPNDACQKIHENMLKCLLQQRKFFAAKLRSKALKVKGKFDFVRKQRKGVKRYFSSQNRSFTLISSSLTCLQETASPSR